MKWFNKEVLNNFSILAAAINGGSNGDCRLIAIEDESAGTSYVDANYATIMANKTLVEIDLNIGDAVASFVGAGLNVPQVAIAEKTGTADGTDATVLDDANGSSANVTFLVADTVNSRFLCATNDDRDEAIKRDAPITVPTFSMRIPQPV